MDNEKLLLMDIDGVVAPYDCVEEIDTIVSCQSYTTWVVRTKVKDWLRKMQDAGVTIVWASTWEAESVALGDDLGLDPMDFVIFETADWKENEWTSPEALKDLLDDDISNDDKWIADDWRKLRPVQEYLSDHPHSKAVWVDDEHREDSASWAAESEKILLVKTDAWAGITDEAMQEIEDFLLNE